MSNIDRSAIVLLKSAAGLFKQAEVATAAPTPGAQAQVKAPAPARGYVGPDVEPALQRFFWRTPPGKFPLGRDLPHQKALTAWLDRRNEDAVARLKSLTHSRELRTPLSNAMQAAGFDPSSPQGRVAIQKTLQSMWGDTPMGDLIVSSSPYTSGSARPAMGSMVLPQKENAPFPSYGPEGIASHELAHLAHGLDPHLGVELVRKLRPRELTYMWSPRPDIENMLDFGARNPAAWQAWRHRRENKEAIDKLLHELTAEYYTHRMQGHKDRSAAEFTPAEYDVARSRLDASANAASEIPPSVGDLVFMGDVANQTLPGFKHTVEFGRGPGQQTDLNWMTQMARKHGLLGKNRIAGTSMHGLLNTPPGRQWLAQKGRLGRANPRPTSDAAIAQKHNAYMNKYFPSNMPRSITGLAQQGPRFSNTMQAGPSSTPQQPSPVRSAPAMANVSYSRIPNIPMQTLELGGNKLDVPKNWVQASSSGYRDRVNPIGSVSRRHGFEKHRDSTYGSGMTKQQAVQLLACAAHYDVKH